MKSFRIALNLLIAIGIIFPTQAQTIWVADNNFNAPTGPNVFATIQAAIDAAADVI